MHAVPRCVAIARLYLVLRLTKRNACHNGRKKYAELCKCSFRIVWMGMYVEDRICVICETLTKAGRLDIPMPLRNT